MAVRIHEYLGVVWTVDWTGPWTQEGGDKARYLSSGGSGPLMFAVTVVSGRKVNCFMLLEQHTLVRETGTVISRSLDSLRTVI